MIFRWLLIFSFLCQVANAQTVIHGIVRDNQTNEGIPGAIVKIGNDGTITDVDGKYTITATAQDANVSALGYVSQSVKIAPGQSDIETMLSRTFVTLNEAQVTAHHFDINSLFINAAKNVPENYLPSSYVLKDDYNVQLYKPHDTVVNYSRNLYFHNGGGDWFGNTCYGIKGDTGRGVMKASERLLLNYMPKLPLLYEEGLSSKLREKGNKIDENPYILATFDDKGEKYYDLISIDTNTKVKYNLIGKALGYTDSKNSNVARRYIMFSEYQFNATTYAMIFRRDLAIETTDKERNAFLSLKTREDLEGWLNNSISAGKHFYTFSWVFRKWKEKYYLQHLYYKDNLVYPLLKNMPLEDYTYRVNHNITEVGVPLPENVVKYNPTIALLSKSIDNPGNEKKKTKSKK